MVRRLQPGIASCRLGFQGLERSYGAFDGKSEAVHGMEVASDRLA
jgi:hypothetical protein